MAPSAWLKRLCSAPGKTRKVSPSWWMKRRRWTGRLAISAASSESARMKPWMGSRIDSTGRAALSVGVGLRGQVTEGAEEGEELPAALQDREERERAFGERLGQELQLAKGGEVEAGGDPVDQLLEDATLAQALEVLGRQGKAAVRVAGQAQGGGQDVAAHRHDAGVALVEPGLVDGPHEGLPVGLGGQLALELEAELAVQVDAGAPVRQVLDVDDAGCGAAGEDRRPALGVLAAVRPQQHDADVLLVLVLPFGSLGLLGPLENVPHQPPMAGLRDQQPEGGAREVNEVGQGEEGESRAGAVTAHRRRDDSRMRPRRCGDAVV